MKVSIRSMIVAPKGKVLVAADLSQAESWIVAHLAHEQNMIWSLTKSDIHADTAAALFHPDNFCVHAWRKIGDDHVCTKCNITITKVERYIGKRFNHASGYRMKYLRAAQVINKDSDKPPFVTVTNAEAKLYSERWHTRYNLKTWWSDIERQLGSTRSLTTPYGRTRVFFAAWGDELFKEATAYVPQSTIADHFNGMVHPELGRLGGLREIRKRLVQPFSDRAIINQSHDSCIIECPAGDGPELAITMIAMLKRPLVIDEQEFVIPADGEIGERLGEMEKIK